MPQFRHTLANYSNLNNAAVMICLIEKEGDVVFPLIKRTQHDLDHHSGQISLPGGKQDGSETLESTALRELEEEIGLSTDHLDILGPLSSLPIPVSGFLVFPFVSIFRGTPKYTLNKMEAESIFEVTLSDLLSPEVRQETLHKDKIIPYFNSHNERVWGATAMILSEFPEVLGDWDK